MKKFLFFAFFLAFTIGFSACSSSNVKTTNSANSTANTAIVNVVNQTVQNVPPNTDVYSEAEKKSQEAFSTNGNVNAQTAVKNPVNNKDNNYNGRPAPDDSTFQSSMNAKGQFVETRTFKNHPQLAKVERVFLTPKDKKIYVYMTNGKVVEVADDKLPTFQATVPGTILQAAGVQLNQPAPESKNSEKKTEQKPTN